MLGLAATSGLTNLDTHWITRPLKDEKLESWWRVEAGEMATLKSWENSKARTEANHVLTCDSVVSQKLNVALIVSCTFFQQAICCAPFSLGSACGSIVHCSCHPSPDAAVSCCCLLFNWICSLLQECYRAVNGKLFPDEGLLT